MSDIQNLIKRVDEIEKLQKQNKILMEVIDMDKAIIDGMRRVLAVSRMVNNLNPDVRLTQALQDYDQCKLKQDKQ